MYVLCCLRRGRGSGGGRLLASRLQNRRVWLVENVNRALDDHVDHVRLGWKRLNRWLFGKHVDISAGTAFAAPKPAAGAAAACGADPFRRVDANLLHFD